MSFRLVATLALVWSVECYAWQSDMKSSYDYESFYQAFRTEDTILFNREIKVLTSFEGIEKDAFYGALLMKKSKSLPSIKRKLDRFKDGRQLLEHSILRDPENPEFRFLRLATQENAPSFLNYNNNKKEDATLIISSFGKIAPAVQKFIREYANTSETLKPEDFK